MRTIYNRYSAFATLSLLSLILFTCKQHELGDTGFPRVRTLFVEMISDTGAVFKGEIMDIPADCEVLDHGFVWTEYPGATTYVEKVSLGSTRKTGEFKASASRAMTEGKKYYFKSFVQTPTLTIFGNELDFISLGSHKPEITSISPSSGSWSDTIVIHGKHFSNSTYQMYVMFGNKTSQNISSTSTEIRTIVPPDLDTANCKLGIKYANVLYPGEQVFTLVPNVQLNSIEPDSGSWNSVIKVKGKGLSSIQKVTFGVANGYVQEIKDSAIFIKVPKELAETNPSVYGQINKFKFSLNKKFKLIPSRILDISPKTGTTGTKINLKGQNFRTINHNIKIDGKEMTLVTASDSLIAFNLSELAISGKKNINFTDGVFNYTIPGFEYIRPELTGFSPSISTWGDTLTLSGKGLDLLNAPKVYFYEAGDYSYTKKEVKIISSNESSIKVIVPLDLNPRAKKIAIQFDNTTLTCPSDLYLSSPVIEKISVEKTNGSSTIVVSGKYFHPTKGIVFITTPSFFLFSNSTTLEIISMSKNEIRGKLPNLISGNYRFKVGNSFGYNELESNLFEYELATPFKTFYSNLNSLGNNNYILYNNNLFLLKNFEQRFYRLDMETKSFTEMGINPIYWPAIFQINSKAYLCTGANAFEGCSKKCYTYDIINNSWEKIDDFPGNARKEAFGFSIGGKGYILNGTDGGNYFHDLWEFDPLNNNWTQITTSNFNTPIGVFNYNNEAYILESNSIWKFNPNQKSLELYSKLQTDQYFRSVFCKNNKAYLDSYYGLWEFDIQSKTWKLILGQSYGYLINIPFEYKNKIFFISHNIVAELNLELL